MSSRAVRISSAELTKEPADIISQVTIEAADPATQSQLLADFETALVEWHEGKYAAVPDGFLLPTRWEPPFKLVRPFASKNPSAKITIKADAFRHEYWIARAVYEGGRQTVDDVLTMNDGSAFEALFKEIHGESHEEWKKENKQGIARGGFAWGSVDGFDASKSELGKAEGQL